MSEWINYNQLSNNLGLSLDETKQLLAGRLEVLEGTSKDNVNISTPYLNANGIKIYQEDFIRSEALAPKSVDLFVTSPPYNVGIDYSTHDDSNDYEQYLEFSRRWLTKAYELARSDGRLCMNIPLDKNKGGQQSVCADVTNIAKQIGWQYHSTIIWNEGNISRRTAWGSWMSASAPYVIAPVEVIVVMYKDSWKKEKRENSTSTITRDEFMAWTNGVWTFNGESKKRIGHPAPFPRELPRRCVRLFSYAGDIVVDPFLGSGTTLLEAWDNQRIGIGFEIAEEYCELAQKRLEKLWQSPKLI